MSNKLSAIYLHIGLEKTGTTSIQAFLDANQDALAKRIGLWLPKSLGHHNHKLLAAYGFEAGSRDIAVTGAGLGSSVSDMENYRATLRAELLHDAERGAGGPGVISSEDLSRLYQPSEVRRVIELLSELTDDLRVIVFVRRQDLLASSRYYSLVRGGGSEAAVFPQKPGGAPYYDYNRTIGNWIDALGADRITLVRFPERPQAERFNSVLRFCELLGIDPASYQMVREQHVSFDAVNQILMQNYNQMRGSYDPEGLAWLMERLLPTNDRALSYIPSEAQARQFYSGYHQGNQMLFRRLGAESQMFTDDFSMYPAENMRVRYQQMGIQRLLRLMEAVRARED
ncbi:hypothetical protein MR829_23385 [Paracoccus versutus]|uniref:hypothetical protein n=1 Tax=Paracoccus versutus TaxID=34007 RepID=UPI001FB662AA|nr:hypothetical protein [Paracoccus versutus]MCJ1903265.1 hypothetical protein [Paracoccus versutus]